MGSSGKGFCWLHPALGWMEAPLRESWTWQAAARQGGGRGWKCQPQERGYRSWAPQPAQPLPGLRATNRDHPAPATHFSKPLWCLTVPLPLPLRPTSEEALKWGESLEKLLLHKCKWASSLFPSLCSLSPSLLSCSPRPRECIWSWEVAFPSFLGPVRCPCCWERQGLGLALESTSGSPALSTGAGSAC